MANTTNLNLVKPAGTDYALVSVINGNWDIIDSKMGAIPANESAQSQITALNNQFTSNVFGGRKAIVFSLSVTATADSGFTEITKTFDTAFSAVPYVLVTPQVQTDALNISVLVKTVSTSSVTFRVGNRGSSDASVVLNCIAIGAA